MRADQRKRLDEAKKRAEEKGASGGAPAPFVTTDFVEPDNQAVRVARVLAAANEAAKPWYVRLWNRLFERV